MTKRRRVFRLQWIGGQWVLREGRETIDAFFATAAARRRATKRDAEYAARRHCRQLHERGELVQLVIHNRDGTFSTEATYGADPRRHKG